MNDAELIQRCIRKEKEAWDIFVQRYSRLIYWAIRKRLTVSGFTLQEDDIQAIFQDVFLTILEGNKLAQLKDVKFLPGWLAMIASNKTVDYIRDKIRNSPRFAPEAMMTTGDSVEQELCDSDLLSVLREIIENMASKEKIVISLNLLEERTHSEIAQMLSMPINTVSTVIARSKDKLKKELIKRGIKTD